MPDKIAGYLEVGVDEKTCEVVINHPDLKPDENGVGHIVFSPTQARNLAMLLKKHAYSAECAANAKRVAEATAKYPPADLSARVLVGDRPITEDHREVNPATGQQRDYVVLSSEERAKGFVRPLRFSYRHVGKLQEFENPDHPSGEVQHWKQRVGGCGTVTSMSRDIAETYARIGNTPFYSATFCVQCCSHFPLNEFVWDGTDEEVGS